MKMFLAERIDQELKSASRWYGINIYMALACQEKTSPIDRKMYKKNRFPP
jgi:hypothetical protein